ncbi:MAG: hypothetical protein WAM47_05090 [Candidatus Sulfotelmatobacter sp.]
MISVHSQADEHSHLHFDFYSEIQAHAIVSIFFIYGTFRAALG